MLSRQMLFAWAFDGSLLLRDTIFSVYADRLRLRHILIDSLAVNAFSLMPIDVSR